MRAAAALVAAWKRLGSPRFGDATLANVLAHAGIQYASAYNAAVRVGFVTERAKMQACAEAVTSA